LASRLRAALLLCLTAAGFAAACRRREEKVVATPAPTPIPIVGVPFEEKAAAMGIAFTHVNGATGKKWMPETMSGGVGILDYDSDGRPDLLFVSSAYWPGHSRAAT